MSEIGRETMSEIGPASGPWDVGPGFGGAGIVVWRGGEPVCHVDERGATGLAPPSREVARANARIIAAAPDLLKLAHYADMRGEGDAEMARKILNGIGCECEPCRQRHEWEREKGMRP